MDSAATANAITQRTADHLPDAELLPVRVGPYRVIEAIGTGAMGRVYRARHELLGRTVAIKVLRDDLARDDGCVARFLAEARAVNLLQHPNVVQVTDVGCEPDGPPWMVMELLDGADLARVMVRERIELARALEIARQTAEALAAIHAAGLVHCDIKPENLILVERGGRERVKVIDFGVARRCEPSAGAPVRVEELVGTPQYMAPEQTCAGELDHRADLYALGTVLFELVTGRPPFRARGDLSSMIGALLFAAPPIPSECVSLPPEVADSIDALIASCLAKEPVYRPADARSVARELACIAARLRAVAKSPEAAAATREDAGWVSPRRPSLPERVLCWFSSITPSLSMRGFLSHRFAAALHLAGQREPNIIAAQKEQRRESSGSAGRGTAKNRGRRGCRARSLASTRDLSRKRRHEPALLAAERAGDGRAHHPTRRTRDRGLVLRRPA